eukprot:jgi/Galph1/2154/GphlegSOOS_G866.1
MPSLIPMIIVTQKNFVESDKTTFDMRFHDFLVINEEHILLTRSAGFLPGCTTVEKSLNVLYILTLYVYLDLSTFPHKGLISPERICKATLSEFPNSEYASSDLSRPVRMATETVEQIPLLYIDEIGVFGVKDCFQFSDLRSFSSNEESSEVYRRFFRILKHAFLASYVFCVVTGRCDAIVRRQEDAMPSRTDLSFLLDLFLRMTIREILRHSKCRKTTLRQIVFPKTRQGVVWLSEIVWNYTGDVPIYVHYVSSQWSKMFVSNPEWKDLPDEELKKKVETIHTFLFKSGRNEYILKDFCRGFHI